MSETHMEISARDLGKRAVAVFCFLNFVDLTILEPGTG